MGKFDAKSLITRKAMGAALKKLMVKKPLQEITVSEITDACGYHRQTFYYHFTTIKDLLRWTFETDVREFIKRNPTNGSWQERLKLMFLFLSKNRTFCLAAYRSLGRETIIDFFGENLNFAVSTVIRKQATERHIDEKNIEFLTIVTSGALISIVERWLCGESSWDADEIVQKISYVAEDLTAGEKLRYEQKNKTDSKL